MSVSLAIKTERYPVAGSFTISRGSRTHAEVVVAELRHGTFVGRGECVPYARYGESVAGVAAEIEAMRAPLADGLDLT
ncbi:MAG TPA: dipeptide epimerase, partial [Xanthobacteraceae bacterium]